MLPTTQTKSNPRVLVVDDEPDILTSVQNILGPAGYSVRSLATVVEAKSALQEGSFDLVITDLYLGKSELGFAVAEAARLGKPAVPVILFTGRPSFDGAQEAIRSQICEIVVKPVDASLLLNACQRAIRNAEMDRRNRQLEAQNKVLAQILPRAIEAKDPTTGGHAERVVLYTDVLAEHCGVSEEDRADLRMASLLHDVGKIGTPEAILTKNGPLTTEEREVIKLHPEMGREILAPLEDSEQIRTWVYQHHERWDGKGYPNGLHQDDVALPGRILILAEVYDALAEERSYKPAWETQRIVDLFRAEAGKHFDPDLAHTVADGLVRMDKKFFTTRPGQLF